MFLTLLGKLYLCSEIASFEQFKFFINIKSKKATVLFVLIDRVKLLVDVLNFIGKGAVLHNDICENMCKNDIAKTILFVSF